MCTLTIKTSRPLLHCTPRMSAAGLTQSLGWLLKHHSSLGEIKARDKKPGDIHTIGISRKRPGWLLLWTSPTMGVEFPISVLPAEQTSR